MRLFVAAILLAIVALFCISCEDSSSPDPNSAWITEVENGYVWGDSTTIKLAYSGETPVSVVFFVDNGIQCTDTEAPFAFTWHVNEFTFGQHFLQAKVFYADDAIYETEDFSVRYMPFTFSASLIEDFDGYTRRDESGNLVGDIDMRDWRLRDPNTETTREVVFGDVELNPQGRKVYINWNTAYEYENEGFFLHRGRHTNDWAMGNTIQINAYLITGTEGDGSTVEYSYVDSLNIEYMTYHYWFEAVDRQGESEVFGWYSCTVQEEVEWETKINPVYPNPAEDETVCNFTLEKPGKVSAIIIDKDADILAVIMLPVTFPAGENSFTWNCADFDYGFYRCVYHIENDDIELVGYGDIVHGIRN